MITHVVLFRWKPEIPDGQVERIITGLSALPSIIPAIRTYRVGPHIGEAGNFDFAVIGTFDDIDGWRDYHTNPDHVRFRDEQIMPWAADRAVLQF